MKENPNNDHSSEESETEEEDVEWDGITSLECDQCDFKTNINPEQLMYQKIQTH